MCKDYVRLLNLRISFTNRKLPSIHSESVPNQNQQVGQKPAHTAMPKKKLEALERLYRSTGLIFLILSTEHSCEIW